MEIILLKNLNQYERLMYIAEENDPIKDATPVRLGNGRHVVRDLDTVPIFPYLECYNAYTSASIDDFFVIPQSGQERTDAITELDRIIGADTTLFGVTVTERSKLIWIDWFQNSRPWLTNAEITELTTRFSNNSLFLTTGPSWFPGENDTPKVEPVPGMTFNITTERPQGEEFIAKMPYPHVALWRQSGVGFVQYENQAVISNRVIQSVYDTFSPELQTIIQDKYNDDNKVLDLIDITGWIEVII